MKKPHLQSFIVPVAMVLAFFAATALYAAINGGPAEHENPSWITTINMTFRPFRLDQVRLLDGRAKSELEINRKYLHEGAPDNLGNLKFDTTTFLHLFRKIAGLPAPGEEMGHTEAAREPRARGQFSGHLLSAYAMTYAATGDPELKKKSDEIIAGLAEVQDSYGDGYLSVWEKGSWDVYENMEKYSPSVPYYCQHKLMAGLWDQYAIAGNKQALEVLKKSAQWFADRYKKQSPELRHYVQHRFENGGMCEMFFNLYGRTGNKDFLMAGEALGKPDWFGKLANKDDNALIVHGNIHIPLVIGLARHHELTGDAKGREVCEFFWDRIANTRSYATGGSTVNEGWGKANDLAGTLCGYTVESCTVYNMLKLTRHLYCWTGGPQYGDYYERNYYNHILGSIGTNGAIKTYNQNLGSGLQKLDHGPTSCCYGTGMESFAKLADSIYFHNNDALFVNLFAPSVLDWRAKGIKVTQNTTFPENERMNFRIEAKKTESFAMNFRVPYWATKGIQVKVNGKAVDTAKVQPVSWFQIEREWKNGDTVELTIPMSLHTQPMPDDKNLLAIMYGPLVLAGGLIEADFVEADKIPGASGEFALKGRVMDELVPAKYHFTGDPAKLDEWIKPVEGKPLTFRTVDQPQDVTLVPYNAYIPKHRGHAENLIDGLGYDWNRNGAAGSNKAAAATGGVPGRFAVYWRMVRDTNDPKLQELKNAQAVLADTKARLVDLVYPRDASEKVANRRPDGKGIDYGSYCGWVYALAKDDNWFSWDMKVLPDAPNSVGIFNTCRIFRPASALIPVNAYWNADFEILVDGKLIASGKPGVEEKWIHYVEFPIPLELTKGKEKVTVKFQPKGNAFARVYGITTSRTKELTNLKAP